MALEGLWAEEVTAASLEERVRALLSEQLSKQPPSAAG
jgi:hypothetical protein